jgi:hypothetical protein
MKISFSYAPWLPRAAAPESRRPDAPSRDGEEIIERVAALDIGNRGGL